MIDVNKLSQSINIINNQKAPDLMSSSKQFSFRHAICLLHPQNYIVNFCTSPECLKPMCSECVKTHTKEHASKGTYGSFETIEEISEQTNQQILKVRQIYKEQQCQVYNYQQKLENQELILREKLKIAREKIQEKINNYFYQIEKDLIDQSKRQKTKQSSDLNQLIHKINENENNMNQMHQQMSTANFVQQIVEFLDQPFGKTASKIGMELGKKIEVLNEQLLDVLFDEIKIESIGKTLQGYIKVENQNYYPDICDAKKEKIVEKKLSPIKNQLPKNESFISYQQSLQQQPQQKEKEPQQQKEKKKGHYLQQSMHFQIPKGHNLRQTNYSMMQQPFQQQQQYIQSQNFQTPIMPYASAQQSFYEPPKYKQFQPNRSVFY